MAGVRVPASVGLRGLNRAPARPQGSQGSDDRARREALDRQDDRPAARRQGPDSLDALDVQGLDRPAPRPTPLQRAKLFDAEQQAKQQAEDAKAKEENPGAWLFQQMRRANLHKAEAKELASALVPSRGGRQARRQADAGVRDSQPHRGLPKVVVYNGSPGPRAPRSPR